MKNNIERTKKIRTQRPDKAGFSLFIGSFLLIAFVPAAYWTNYYYRFFKNNFSVLQTWKEHPENIPDYLPAKDLLYSQASTVESSRLQAVLLGAGSLILLISAIFLFIRAYRIFRLNKAPEYMQADWRSFDKPAGNVEVLYSRTATVAAIFFYVFFGGISFLAIGSSFKPDGIRLPGIVIGLFNAVLIGVVYYLRHNAEKKSIKYFDASGVMRKDGTFLLWSAFCGVIRRMGRLRYGGKMVYRTELVFENGVTVWIIGQRIKNYVEVNRFVETLPVAVVKAV
ncbi:MAG: hypothetical protein ABIX01_09185 [Chitinophagaceae bacterium]